MQMFNCINIILNKNFFKFINPEDMAVDNQI